MGNILGNYVFLDIDNLEDLECRSNEPIVVIC
jgi:hypothetical protein